MNNQWISVNDRLPEHKQEVLTYYYDEDFDIERKEILTFCQRGDVLDTPIDLSGKTVEERFFNNFINPKIIIAPKDGFYISEIGKDGNLHYRRHADIITHWMPLPDGPKINPS